MHRIINKERVIGERTGRKHGPLMIILAEIHGNEPAGYFAVQELFRAIDSEYVAKPNFDFRGRVVALRGNMAAIKQNVRYVDKDLNRSWLPDVVERIKQTDDLSQLNSEEKEIKELIGIIDYYIETYEPTRVVVLDIHTTTAHGGIFTIPATNPEARRIGLSMHAPVLHGFLQGLKGTTLHYFTRKNFDVDINAVCFEAGQHSCHDSPKHAISAIINCFTAIGGFYAEDIETKHDALLEERSRGLPLEAKLLYVHPITEEDGFRMKEDHVYNNFDPVEKGELLAHDKNGPIYSPHKGLILMPLYQKQGSDGFFIVEELTPRPADYHIHPMPERLKLL